MRTLFIRYRFMKITVVALLLTFLLSTAVVSAHRLGGQFRHTAGTWRYIGYTQNGSYRTPVLNAAYSWQNTPTRVVVFQEGIAYSEADFYGYYYNTTWWGMTVHHPCSGWGCTYQWADLYLNTRTLGSQSDFIRQKVAAHEFGHGIGLAHTTDWWYRSIMKQGTLSYNTPQTHDINDTNGIYR